MIMYRLLIVMLLGLNVVAQNHKFGDVSKEMLQEKFYPTDSSAKAAYLLKDRNTFLKYNQNEGFSLVTKIHEIIKIYSKDGFNYATKSIALYKNSTNQETISGLKGYTYSLVNGKSQASKLKKEGIFKTELSKYYNQTKFTFPKIKEGSIIEYKYEIHSPFYSNVDEFKFQHDIPVKVLNAKFDAPEYFSFKSSYKGFLKIIPKKTSGRGQITFLNKSRSGGGFGATITNFSSDDIEYKTYIESYNMFNIPALKSEPFVNNISNYRSAVKYELSYTKFPNSTAKYYSTTWKDVVKSIFENSSFGAELNKTGYFEKEIDALIADVSDPIARARVIFNYVTSNIKWNGYHSKYASKGVRKAYKEHTGNVAEINLMLTSMLRYAGLDANPVLVSTRKNGIPLFPTREGYNYVICGIETPNDIMLLDATSKFSAPNILPFRALNWQGRIVRKSGSSELIDLYPKNISKSTINMFATLNADGTVKGKMRAVKTGHQARRYRTKYNKTDKEDFIKDLERKYSGIEINEFDVTEHLNVNKPITETCNFTIESQADVINDKIYFSPLFFLKTNENPFKLADREFPVDFGYPTDDVYRFNITLPEGYNVEFIPESKVLQLPDNLGKLTYRLKLVGNTIQLIIDSKINKAIISPMYYNAVKSYFSDMVELENEQIVLKKA